MPVRHRAHSPRRGSGGGTSWPPCQTVSRHAATPGETRTRLRMLSRHTLSPSRTMVIYTCMYPMRHSIRPGLLVKEDTGARPTGMCLFSLRFTKRNDNSSMASRGLVFLQTSVTPFVILHREARHADTDAHQQQDKRLSRAPRWSG